MSVQARSNTDTDNLVGIIQLERASFRGEGDVAVVVDAALADLRVDLLAFAQRERDAGRLPA